MSAKPIRISAVFVLLIGLSIQYVQAVTCDVSSAGVAFGVYDPASSANRDATGSIRLACDVGVSAQIYLSVGNGVGASYSGGRKMTTSGGTLTLTYNIYSDIGRTIVFGDGTDGSSFGQTTSSSAIRNRIVYGRIPGSQSSALPGSYNDTLVVTLQY